MSTASNRVAVYGASGHTGQFIVRELLHRGLEVRAVGRSAARLAESLPAGVETRAAAIDDAAALRAAFDGCALVINAAGPFLDTAAPVAQAALAVGCHYLDVSAEQGSAQACFADLDAPARAAGRVVVPAAAFYGGLADLLATALAADGPIATITVAIALNRWWPTAGTRRTGERNTLPRLVQWEGRLQPLAEVAEAAPDWRFAEPLGEQAMLEMPFSEVIALSQHLRVGRIRSLLNRSALADIRDSGTPPPSAADASGRSAQRFELQVRVEQGGLSRLAGARGRDIYAVTAPIVCAAAARLLAPGYARSGALSLAQAVDPLALLADLQQGDLALFGELPMPHGGQG